MTYPGIEFDKAALAVNPDLAAIEERRKLREAEYAEWVAVVDIPWGHVLAATPGMAIPTSTVERLHWDELGLVARRTTKEARAVLEPRGLGKPEEVARWAEQDKAARQAAREAAAAEKADAEKPADQHAVKADDETPADAKSTGGRRGGNKNQGN
jgi:hypothetical protein